MIEGYAYSSLYLTNVLNSLVIKHIKEGGNKPLLVEAGSTIFDKRTYKISFNADGEAESAAREELSSKLLGGVQKVYQFFNQNIFTKLGADPFITGQTSRQLVSFYNAKKKENGTFNLA